MSQVEQLKFSDQLPSPRGVALAEQLAIDQPPGLRARYQRLLARHGEPMRAQHAAIDCLGETIWRAQRDQAPFDAAVYLDCLDRQLGT